MNVRKLVDSDLLELFIVLNFPNQHLNHLKNLLTDVDECLEGACDPNAKCINTYGSHYCECEPGMWLILQTNSIEKGKSETGTFFGCYKYQRF